jgi:hypothetical protein
MNNSPEINIKIYSYNNIQNCQLATPDISEEVTLNLKQNNASCVTLSICTMYMDCGERDNSKMNSESYRLQPYHE